MNINAVTNYIPSFKYVKSRGNDKNVSVPNYGNLKMVRQLSADTVSFTGTPKKLESRANDITRDLAKQLHSIAAEEQPMIENYINRLLGDLCVTDYNPGNIINDIKGRAKTVDSIIEKASTRLWTNKDEILTNMTDLNGVKVVLRDGSRSGVNTVIDRFLKEIEAGNLYLVEVENKRPAVAKKLKGYKAQQYDYASSDKLEQLVETMNAMHPSQPANYIPVDYTNMNYPALHFLFRIPSSSRVFEMQIMGRDVALYKDLDDIIYKILNNKNVSKKYQKLVDIIAPLNEPGNASIKEKFNNYRGHVFEYQRRKAPHIRGNEKYTEYFLPIGDEIEDGNLRSILDMNKLYSIYLECNKKAGKKKIQNG